MRKEVAASAERFEETTTEAVSDMFTEQGVTPSSEFVRKFLHRDGQSLHSVIPRSSYELDNTEQVEKQIRAFWVAVHYLHLAWKNWMSLDEKPLFLERFRRRIWRKVGLPAFVRSFGKTRQRETVILPSLGDGRKLPIIFLFHGTLQLKVVVPHGYPCLFTNTANINSDALQHILKRAIFPNLPANQTHGLLLDDHKAHFLEAVQKLLAEHNIHPVKIEHPLTK